MNNPQRGTGPTCASCNTALVAGTRFCGHCGTPLQPPSAQNSFAESKQQGHRISNAWLIAIAVIVLGIAKVASTSLDTGPAQAENTAVALPQQSIDNGPPVQLLIDIPRLAFQKQAAVLKVLGKPVRTAKDHNGMVWSEGPILEVRYRRADCLYFRNLLVSISYFFKKRPPTAADALELTGFPRSAVDLDKDHGNHLPFRAFYAPNREYRNPIRCCGGLLFQWVSLPEDISEMNVNFANINDHFLCWPEEVQMAWLRAGGPKITQYEEPRQPTILQTPKDGNLLDAQVIPLDESCHYDP